MFLFVFAVVMYTRSFVRGLLFGVDRGKVKACGEESFRVVQFLGSQDFHGIFTRKTIDIVLLILLPTHTTVILYDWRDLTIQF